MKCICYNVEAPLAPANQVNDAPVMDQPALPGPIIEAQAQDQAPVVPAQVQEPPPPFKFKSRSLLAIFGDFLTGEIKIK